MTVDDKVKIDKFNEKIRQYAPEVKKQLLLLAEEVPPLRGFHSTIIDAVAENLYRADDVVITYKLAQKNNENFEMKLIEILAIPS
jgi:hypothetical protein